MNILRAIRPIKSTRELKKALLAWNTKITQKEFSFYLILNTYKKPKEDVKDVGRISVKKGEMTTDKIRKSKFSQLNDKRLYFPNAVISLPFGHLSLSEIDEYKKDKGWRIEKYFWTEKEKLLELEKSAPKNCPRMDFLNNILEQVPKIVNVDCTKFDRNTKFLYREERQQNILDFILSQGWRTSTPTTDNSTETS